LAVPREIEDLAAIRESTVVLTCPWHERDTRSLAERLGARVVTPMPDEGSPDMAWLWGADRSAAHLYSAGDRLPVGVEAFPGRLPNDLVLWIASRRAVIAGDTLVDFGQGLEIPSSGYPRMCRVTRSQRACARCFSCRSTSYSRRTAARQTGPRSGARSPDTGA
jgi:hypothetical protein